MTSLTDIISIIITIALVAIECSNCQCNNTIVSSKTVPSKVGVIAPPLVSTEAINGER